MAAARGPRSGGGDRIDQGKCQNIFKSTMVLVWGCRIFDGNACTMIRTISLFFIITVVTAAACNSGASDKAALQAQVDSLQRKLDDAYKPGLGEFMSGIQVHHAKLWFAGTAGNWKLADFEIGEIKEALDDISRFCAHRPEITSLPMIRPAVDSVAAAVGAGNGPAFRSAFTLLTTTCNNCHRATKHEFNVIKTPETPPFTNQVFTK
jgi:hypothetical protein